MPLQLGDLKIEGLCPSLIGSVKLGTTLPLVKFFSQLNSSKKSRLKCPYSKIYKY
jgi:hypothetical protein